MPDMRTSSFYRLLVVAAVLAACSAVDIEKGWITLETRTGESTERHKVDLSSTLKQVLNLTQSSVVRIESKVRSPPSLDHLQRRQLPARVLRLQAQASGLRERVRARAGPVEQRF